MQCRDCKYWQGSSYSQWADCYRIIADIEPKLLTLTRNEILGDEDSTLIPFTVPFDPHDVYLWHHLEEFNLLYTNVLAHLPNLGIRKDYDKYNNCYIQTHIAYGCGREPI
jgi:hypothetical protein